MATLISRKTSRAQIAVLLNQITTFVAVYDHEMKNFDGRSPVAMVNSDGSRQQFPFYTQQWHRFRISLFWKRADDDATDDYLDDLATAVLQKLYDNAEESGYWADIDFAPGGEGEYSEMDYVLVDGEQYRREVIRIAVQVIGS